MTAPQNATGGSTARLVEVELDEGSISRSTPDIEHERAVAAPPFARPASRAPVIAVAPPSRRRLPTALCLSMCAGLLRASGGGDAWCGSLVEGSRGVAGGRPWFRVVLSGRNRRLAC